MQDLYKFITLVEYMRKCQREYTQKFSDKAKSELISAEKNVDKYIQDYKKEREVLVGSQRGLFD